tara:strand:+ start:6479 stop:7330 length:852 start_codon:yes stop_codon:yes gene_type:complete
MSIGAIAAGAQAIGSIFGKKKTKIKRTALSPDIDAGMRASGKTLKGDVNQIRGAGQQAFGNISDRMGGLSQAYDTGMDALGGYGASGDQFRRSQAAINQYGQAARAANQDALDATSRRANFQQAVMGSGGGLSPFMAAMLQNQYSAQNRNLERELGGLRMANVSRWQDIGRQIPMQQMALNQAYGSNQMAPMNVLGMQNQLANRRLMDTIAANRAGHDTRVTQKDNWAAKIGKLGGAMGGLQMAGMQRGLMGAKIKGMGYDPTQFTGLKGMLGMGKFVKDPNP